MSYTPSDTYWSYSKVLKFLKPTAPAVYSCFCHGQPETWGLWCSTLHVSRERLELRMHCNESCALTALAIGVFITCSIDCMVGMQLHSHHMSSCNLTTVAALLNTVMQRPALPQLGWHASAHLACSAGCKKAKWPTWQVPWHAI